VKTEGKREREDARQRRGERDELEDLVDHGLSIVVVVLEDLTGD